jgi:hypothetical protein
VTLSRLAARALAFLETIPDRRVCEDCTGTYLDVYRQQVLNTFRGNCRVLPRREIRSLRTHQSEPDGPSGPIRKE